MAIKPPNGVLTDDLIDEICALVENGNYITVASAACGLGDSTIRSWRARGRALIEAHPDIDLEDPEQFPDKRLPEGWTWLDGQAWRLENRLSQSEAKAEAYAVLIVRKHMPDQWTAAMTYLERRFPQRWRKRQTIETTQDADNGLDETALIGDPEAVRLLHEALAQVAGSRPRELEPVIDATVEPEEEAPHSEE